MKEPRPYLVRCRFVDSAEACRRCRIRQELQARGFTVVCVPREAELEAAPQPAQPDALERAAAFLALAMVGAAGLLSLLGWLQGRGREPRRREEVKAWGGFLI
jgi:hypothetical protein